jgi:hypothetical protein
MSIFDPKLKISKDLYSRLSVASEVAGCASVDEFVERILEQTLESLSIREVGSNGPSAAQVEDITKKLKGLGYLE